MAEFTLDTLRAESEKRYGSTTVDMADGKITFRALLRLPDEAIAKVQDLVQQVNEISQSGREDFDALQTMDAHMSEALRLAADDDERFETFRTQLDRADLLTLFEYWSNGTQPGEASA